MAIQVRRLGSLYAVERIDRAMACSAKVVVLAYSQRHEQVFSVNVLVRVRPTIKEDRKSSSLSPEAEREQKMLPLHQRLQMIKVS